MSSQRRIDASRANGARSQGPVTAEGKQRSAQNAIRHGLLAQTVVLDDENAAAFAALMADYIGRFQPADRVEMALVEEMAVAVWRGRRAWAIECGLWNGAAAAAKGPTKLKRIGQAFSALADGPEFALMSRYETRQTRIFQRALKNLLALRNADLPNEPNPNTEHGCVFDVAEDPDPLPADSHPAGEGPDPANRVSATPVVDSDGPPAPTPCPTATVREPAPAGFPPLSPAVLSAVRELLRPLNLP